MTLTQQIIWTLCLLWWLVFAVAGTVSLYDDDLGIDYPRLWQALVASPAAAWLLYAIAYVWGWR